MARLAALVALAATVLASAATAATPDFAPCTIGDGRARLAADCATFDVPLDHDDPAAGSIGLAVARLRARRDAPDGAAFTLLAGGPGQSAIDSYAALAFAFRHVARDHDVILVDQRGTGASSRLDCPAAGALAGGELDGALERSPDALARGAAECLASLELDPRRFTTSVAVRDLELVRERLGIDAWHLYGVSYGTRVAQHYARRFPDRVRTMTLDAVVPPDRPLGPDIAPFAQRALDRVFARCAADTDCAARFPDIGARTRAWFDALGDAPLEIEHEDLTSGETRRSRFAAADLAALLRLMTYSAQTASLLPSMLDAAIESGHVAPLVRQARVQETALGESLASGMHHAIVCTEDAPRLPPDAAARAVGTYLGPALVEALAASCRGWPIGVRDADIAEPLAVDVPTLLLSGEADPITPPAYGARVAATLPRSRHLVNAGQGHMQAPLGCVPALLARFIATADPAALDTECLARLAPPPFFVDANGPRP